jgi:hypothetical protein
LSRHRRPAQTLPRMLAQRPIVEQLESRELLSAAPVDLPFSSVSSLASPGSMVSHPMVLVHPMLGGPPSGALTPPQVQQGYAFNQITFGGAAGNGAGETIAIVDAQDDSNIQADLNTFDAQFNLPNTTVVRVSQTGGTNYPAPDSTGGWELEESLDVEWAHAMAPQATIMLVEANSANDTDLLAAVDYAAAHANVVSMSWGGSEFSGETSSSYENHFIHAGVTFVASSGDSGAPVSWPASSPNVVAVGGTTLTLNANNNWLTESGWSGSGGGPSGYESQPAYQSGVVSQTSTARANPDVAYGASPSNGFAVYDSVPYSGTVYDWLAVGGTSAGAPQWAALFAIADQGRVLSGQQPLDSTSPTQAQTILYSGSNRADYHDITSGTSTGSPNYSAGVGYDYVTGLGSPIANLVAQSLVGVAVAPSDHLVVSGPTADTAGASFNVTVTADTSAGATDSAYRGTIHFSSSDVQAGLPASYQFTATDAGVQTFSVTLKTAGTQSVTAADTSNSAITGTLSSMVVSPAAASQIVLTGLPSSTTVGSSLPFTITAKDPYGNVASGFASTVHFTSSDTQATLPPDYLFVASDHGAHSFSLTFHTAGTQSVTASASPGGLSVTQTTISVAPSAPLNLSAAVASNTQINLSWTGSAGATIYVIQRSGNGTSGWTQVGSTAAGTTTYQDTGLAQGTTYYYRVAALVGSTASAYSNVASATTTGVASNDTLWSNSYVPSENAYSWGSYELGVKFRADLNGTVTGVRFYKQSWMNGWTHVGHLWSSSGALLATATFNNETYSGWQQVSFSSPVSILANTVYIVSFSSGGGYFGINTSYFSGSGVDNGPLHALANGVSGGDGVYHSGNGAFPSVSGSGMNFWADLVFSPSGASPHATMAGLPAPTSTGALNVTPAVGPQAGTTTVFVAPPSSSAVSTISAVGSATTRRSPFNASVQLSSRGTVPQAQTLGAARFDWFI